VPDFFYAILGVTFAAMPFIVAVLLAFGLVSLVVGLNASPVVGAIAILLLFLLETTLVYLLGLNLGITVYPQDLLFVPMALVVLIRLGRPGAVKRIPRPLWVLTGMMALSFVVGLVQHGTSAGVEFRNDFYFITGVFYFSSFEWPAQRISRLLNWLFPVVLIIMLVVWYRWVADATDLDWVEPLWRYADATGVPLRVVNAQETLLLGQALILLIYAMAVGNSSGRWVFLVPLLALTVLVLQHRTVWVATFLSALMAFVIVRQNQAKLARRLGLMVGLTALVLVPLLSTGKFNSATSSVTDLAAKATSTTGGTFVGRVQGWDALLKQWGASGPRTWAIGNPYGSGFDRSTGPSGQDITYAPHDYYVQLLLRTGLIGLMAFIALHWRLLRGAIRLGGAPHAAMTGYAMVGLLFSQLLFDIPYSPSYTHGLFLGIILGLLLQYEREGAEVGHAQAAARHSTGLVVARPHEWKRT